MRSPQLMALLLAWASSVGSALAAPLTTVADLVAAVRDGAEGATVEIAAGTYAIEAPLVLKSRMTLQGAGMDQTIITNAKSWQPALQSLPDPEVSLKGLDSNAYLIRLADKASGIIVSNLTLHGPQVHGAIFGFGNSDLHLHHLRIKETLWSGVRTLGMHKAKIHDCEFIDAGGKWNKGGERAVKGGITGGGIFATWMADSVIHNNRFTHGASRKDHPYFGIKIRQAKRCRIHHNTIEVNFSIEAPFENDEDVEIDHNVCSGVISIPKHAGGPVPKSGLTFHIHHNWMKDSYSIEFVRNGVEIDHNFFEFDPQKDHGNLISAFGHAPAKGPATFHNNVVKNPGRGVIWINEVYNNLTIRNNHILTQTTTTPRKEGLFGFNAACDFRTITIRDNRIECQGQPRPLLRAKESYKAIIENNDWTNVADADQLKNTPADRVAGLEKPLQFECGVNGEFTVNGLQAGPTPKK